MIFSTKYSQCGEYMGDILVEAPTEDKAKLEAIIEEVKSTMPRYPKTGYDVFVEKVKEAGYRVIEADEYLTDIED